MALVYILPILQVSGLIEDRLDPHICPAFNRDMLFWMKYMKKIWPQLHIHRYAVRNGKSPESVLGTPRGPCTTL